VLSIQITPATENVITGHDPDNDHGASHSVSIFRRSPTMVFCRGRDLMVSGAIA
jgi:hypothetical protein